ncbi:MAG: hypothetical protein JEY94_12650 [Melioribacteraceae bacterium]|nr:hypothetical protein [Melioribacteraceae bacterium]
MKKYNKVIIIFLLSLMSNLYSQENSSEFKNSLIDTLKNHNSTMHYPALQAIEKHNFYEALPTIENQFWSFKRFIQIQSLEIMQRFNSEKTSEFAYRLLDTLDINPFKNEDYGSLVSESKMEISGILFRIGDFTTAQFLFDYIDDIKPNINPLTIDLLELVAKNYLLLESSAKQELLNIITHSDSDEEKYFALIALERVYGTEMIPTIVELFNVSNNSATKSIILRKYFSKYSNQIDLRTILQNKILIETSESLRRSIGEVLLYGVGGSESYNFIKNYLHNERSETVKFLLGNELKNYFPNNLKESTNVSANLDTLTSYTNQSFGYEWSKDDNYKDELLLKAEKAKNYLTISDSINCRKEIEAFQNNVAEVYADSAGSYPKYISTAAYRFLYYQAQYILDRLPELALDNNLTGEVEVNITNDGENYTFTYSFSNSDTSNQLLETIYIANNDTAHSLTLPSGWVEITGVKNYNLSGFKTTNGISAGETTHGFTITTTGIPTIGKVYLQSNRTSIDTADIFNNSFIVETLVPNIISDEFDESAFIEKLISCNDKCFEKNWISAEWVKNVFFNSLTNSKNFINQNLPQSAIPVMQQLNTILDSYLTSNFITNEAHVLLKLNSEYLITKLNIMVSTPPADAVNLLNEVIAANNYCRDNGMYSAEWVYNTFNAILDNAVIVLNQNNVVGCLQVIQQLVATMDAYKPSGFITQEGYDYFHPKCTQLIELLNQ